MARCLEALRVCANKIRRAKAVDLRCVATEACRSASNGQAFLRRVERETGLRLEAIPNAEEARLALVGCTPLFDAARNRALMFDIGGGSTELIWLALENGRPEMIDYLSIPRGVVNLTERHGESLRETGPFEEVIRLVDEKLVAFCERHRIVEAVGRDEVQMLGTSGTVTTLAGVHFDLALCQRLGLVQRSGLGKDGCADPFAIVSSQQVTPGDVYGVAGFGPAVANWQNGQWPRSCNRAATRKRTKPM